MPENSSGPSNAGWITIVAAIITAIGGVTAAYLLRPVPAVAPIPGSTSNTGKGDPGSTGTGNGHGTGSGFVVPPPVSLLYNRNLNGSDIYNPAPKTASAIACVEMCQKNGECVAMTYVKSGGECWLKSSVPPSYVNGDMISWIK